MTLRGSQWLLQLFHEQAQSGQTVEQWRKEHQVACSTHYRWKKALRERLLEQMEAEQRQPSLPATITVSQSKPQFVSLSIPEAVRGKASARGSAPAQDTPAIRIKIGETVIEKEKIEISDLPKINPLKLHEALQQLVDAINGIPEVPSAYPERWANR